MRNQEKLMALAISILAGVQALSDIGITDQEYEDLYNSLKGTDAMIYDSLTDI